MPQGTIRTDPEPTPFWRRLGDVARYPLHGDALLTLLVLTAFGVLAWLPGVGWILSLVAYFSGYKYAFEVLLHSANGHDEAPVLTVHARNDAVWRLLIVLLALLLTVKLTANAGMGAAAVAMIAIFALLQPCLLASLATGDGLFGALNPANALRMIGRIGGAYFVVSAALFLIQLLALLAGRALVAFMPGGIATLLVDMVFYWGLFASFHLLGRTMYCFHGELGYTPSLHAETLPTLQDRDQALLDRAAVHAEGDDLIAAIGLLHDEIRDRSVTPAVHERYRLLLRQTGDTEALDVHAGRFIAMLVQDRQERRALSLLREALDANPDFARLAPEHGEWLARRALDLGQFRLASDAWRALLRVEPRHPHAPHWALQAAQLLHERFGDPGTARAALSAARNGCRDESACARLDAAIRALPADSGTRP